MQETPDQVRRIFENSVFFEKLQASSYMLHLRFTRPKVCSIGAMSHGMTEKVFSAGDNYILTATSTDGFRVGLFNESFDDTLELTKENLVLFTVYSAKLMIDDAATEITELENSVSMANKNYGDFAVFLIMVWSHRQNSTMTLGLESFPISPI